MRIGDRYFAKHGAKTVFIGRWIALIRFATAWLAGINGMRFRTFFVWNALGGITWAVTYGLIGYYGGNAVAHVLERAGVIAAALIVIAVVVLMVAGKLRERRMEQQIESEPGSSEPSSDRGVSGGDESSPDDGDGPSRSALVEAERE